jgi:hypothetical protein
MCVFLLCIQLEVSVRISGWLVVFSGKNVFLVFFMEIFFFWYFLFLWQIFYILCEIFYRQTNCMAMNWIMFYKKFIKQIVIN